MMIHNLAVDVTVPLSNAGEALSYGLPLSLFGFCVVFFVLALLWGILMLFKLFFYTIPNSKKQAGSSASVKKSAPAPNVQNNAEAAVTVSDDSVQDGKLIAAITAAIEAFRSQSGAVGAFRVVSFKKRK